ncbi:bifunctional 2-octaprenyl-6-methoxy-1,4-benzoquinone methylase and S-adenosylmethionine:2-DMK methyltransferase [Beijerinckiaceae bacterium RH AL1]|nr:bifunctional demethylmenaquinone methyltransferase/2-methoxy-6-polyprenyl-1,4-benzoquinol methylase UbiE [Beijerinckiaceae bacterium]VVB49471.1 bifunctional 2-octaprenyl-6-methoxy-1,4-benzoquinone methylase and S-adenosylmethionine:2-DMK methyltransferase [Beijerinckiaceae bacterium RH CH11]VVB49552.1 bifunctional 2-octaprenyl-6-methoxy-1,4-benzoquinone methylase and S-adenosylmethionine:2-DMK methyltransferase [Beijerinckiaceae bacterium RH AL8]VVC56919.1 bifunctional 2-octaprenyl-6-methoxy-
MTRPPRYDAPRHDAPDFDAPDLDAANAIPPDADETTHFGYEDVRLGEKQGRVDDVFHKVARRYDLMNDLMSGGLHRLWKDRLVAMVNPPKRLGFDHLDVAGGTGDVAFRIARAGGDRTRVTVLDINADMLQVGRDRAAKARLTDRVEFVEANAEELPFEASRYDAYTVAFGIRNVPRIQVALTEAYRVLRRGGHFLCLEFSPDVLPLLDRVYETYSFKVIPWIGERVTGDRESYQYLVESIRKFPGAAAFEGQLRAAGFRQTQVVPLSGGIVAIHSGWKL